jgi:hypothetical protein
VQHYTNREIKSTTGSKGKSTEHTQQRTGRHEVDRATRISEHGTQLRLKKIKVGTEAGGSDSTDKNQDRTGRASTGGLEQKPGRRALLAAGTQKAAGALLMVLGESHEQRTNWEIRTGSVLSDLVRDCHRQRIQSAYQREIQTEWQRRKYPADKFKRKREIGAVSSETKGSEGNQRENQFSEHMERPQRKTERESVLLSW